MSQFGWYWVCTEFDPSWIIIVGVTLSFHLHISPLPLLCLYIFSFRISIVVGVTKSTYMEATTTGELENSLDLNPVTTKPDDGGRDKNQTEDDEKGWCRRLRYSMSWRVWSWRSKRNSANRQEGEDLGLHQLPMLRIIISYLEFNVNILSNLGVIIVTYFGWLDTL